jgi:chromosome segregation ATPase
LQSAISEATGDRDAWKVKTENLEVILADKETQIHNFIERVESLKREIENKDAQIRNKEGHINGLLAHARNLDEIIAKKEDHINGLMAHAGNLEKIIAEKVRDINNLKCSIKEKDIQISLLKDFEEKIKSTPLYKVYRFLKLHKTLPTNTTEQ